MLNKILSNLKFNTDYLSLLKEYQVKESREKYVRGVGFLFIALAFLVQIVAYTPVSSQTSASGSNNDLIFGGVSSKQQIVDACNQDLNYVAIIYGSYGISCAEIASPTSPVVTINSTDYGGQLWSVGHLPYSIAGETPVSIYGGGTIYWRLLHGWDTYGSSTYTALRVTSADNKPYWILFNCGNLVSLGFPSQYTPPAPAPTPPPAPTPKPTPKPLPKPTPCTYNAALPANSPSCKPCTNSANATDELSCLVYSKAASNITQNIKDANNTTANPGDTITYTLTVTNKGKAPAKNFVIEENISDVLDYANLTTPVDASLNSVGELTWPAVTIPASSAVSKQFNVQVKNPLPTYAVNPDDPDGYNNIMTNVYGNTINIAVPQNKVTAITTSATTSLPNTGPGQSIFIFFIITVFVGYFYSRSRLLSKEALIAEAVVTEGDK